MDELFPGLTEALRQIAKAQHDAAGQGDTDNKEDGDGNGN